MSYKNKKYLIIKITNTPWCKRKTSFETTSVKAILRFVYLQTQAKGVSFSLRHLKCDFQCIFKMDLNQKKFSASINKTPLLALD